MPSDGYQFNDSIMQSIHIWGYQSWKRTQTHAGDHYMCLCSPLSVFFFILYLYLSFENRKQLSRSQWESNHVHIEQNMKRRSAFAFVMVNLRHNWSVRYSSRKLELRLRDVGRFTYTHMHTYIRLGSWQITGGSIKRTLHTAPPPPSSGHIRAPPSAARSVCRVQRNAPPRSTQCESRWLNETRLKIPS